MTGMGRPKHFVPFPKWTWTIIFVICVICWLIAGNFQ